MGTNTVVDATRDELETCLIGVGRRDRIRPLGELARGEHLSGIDDDVLPAYEAELERVAHFELETPGPRAHGFGGD
jgi:hypothetical protein